jgi:hypothetical protein
VTPLIKYLASRYLSAIPLAHQAPIWLSKTPINHLLQSPFSQWQPFKPFLNVQHFEIEHYCKTLHNLTYQIKYLASTYLNALTQAHQTHILLSKTPVNHLFQSPCSLSGSVSNLPSMDSFIQLNTIARSYTS